ncbi:unnamed protein product [Lathyrus sativus]|nr:unnamed protein product [Lathyrus sativus]
MASMLSFLINSLSHRNKPSNNTIKDDHINDDLAIVKAAAWAWYQHGSGSCHEGDAISSEFFIRTTTRREPRPSRYKLELEAKRSMEKEITESSPVHRNKEESLLDEYEVQSISRHLNNLIVSNNNHNRKKHVSRTDKDNTAITTSADEGVKKNNKKKKIIRKGFFFKHGVVCGREGDVVDSSSVVSRDRRRLTKSVPSVRGFK